MTRTKLWRAGYAYERDHRPHGERFIALPTPKRNVIRWVCTAKSPSSVHHEEWGLPRHVDVERTDWWEELPMTDEEKLWVTKFLLNEAAGVKP
jgi:hypothetical protein